MNFFEELNRRNVFKIAIAYSITSWVIAQMAALAADSFLAPEWVMKMIITILMLGFPVALVMAWAYEMTPGGLKRERDLDSSEHKRQASGKLDRTIVVALIAALAYIAYDKLVIDPKHEANLLETVQSQIAEPVSGTQETGETTEVSKQSIAVLPFVNMSDDAANEYFSEGLSEELLNLLVKIPELQVAARTSSFSFKGKDVKIAQIAKELNVSHVLEGSVRKSGNHVRITAQLIKADDGFHLWSETYDRTLDDIFVVQDEIANAVVEALKITLMGSMPETQQTDPEVYALYLQGKYFTNIKGKENLEKAVEFLEQGLAIDPDYAPLWVAIGVTYQEQRKYRFRSTEEANTLSMAAVEKALAIDSNMASAWASLAYMKRSQLDWNGARVAIEKALELEPNSTFVMGTAATLAGTFGQLERSIELFEKYLKLDPLSLSTLRALGSRYANIGRYDDALKTFNRLKAINPQFPGINFQISQVYLFKGEPETALAEIEKGPHERIYPYAKATALSTMGKEEEAQAIINKLVQDPDHILHFPMASIFAWRGENDLAFEWLEKAYQQRPGNLVFFLRNPWFKNLENDPRYLVFVEKLGLLEAWKTMPKPLDEAQQGLKK